jgi:hypothetical protein
MRVVVTSPATRPPDEAEAWLEAQRRANPGRVREVADRFPVLSPGQIRRRLSQEMPAGDAVTVMLTATRWAYSATGGPKDRTRRRLGPLPACVGDRESFERICENRRAAGGPLAA